MEETKGVIYILTNPAFKQFVKIGYAKDINERLRTLNTSSAIPYSFRLYATYKVNSELSDKEVHSIIDTLNPDLRTKEENGKKSRVREFFEMTPERAYSILEAIAKINNLETNLKKESETKEDKANTNIINKEIESQLERGKNFSFSKCQIPIGAELEFINDSNIKCKVVGDRKIEYNGQEMYLTGFAKKLLNINKPLNGTLYFTYNKKNLQNYYREFQK